MNPIGYRMEEKKESDYRVNNNNNNNHRLSLEEKSSHSYRSTPSSRSSVLERAREYNRRIDEQNNKARSKSLERNADNSDEQSTQSGDGNRSRSVGRSPQNNNLNTRERAMASVRKDSNVKQQTQTSKQQRTTGTYSNSMNNNGFKTNSMTMDPTMASPSSSSMNRGQPASRNNPQNNNNNMANTSNNNRNVKPTTATTTNAPSSNNRNNKNGTQQHKLQQPSQIHQNHAPPQEGENNNNNPAAVVTPELLVDALSGHEDGLLAIAEKLMEHYDAGYDVMGEAIIDAFADVQKLFQHVVEAAHMEGAAFEASRREAELADQRKFDQQDSAPSNGEGDGQSNLATPQGAGRHDEFVDQDVKDVLTEAIRKGTALRDANQIDECYRMYEQACQSASALLPVDSDHRGRLQLSIARAESMGTDRACAILRYAIDDVLRSGIRAGRTPLPDPSKRADVVLNKPTLAAQSPEEALASLTEEMKEILNAPVYNDSPLQSVATRFWAALLEAQKAHQKNEDRLEHALGKLKGDFLLSRAEWEERLNQSNEKAEALKEKYEKLKESYHSAEAMRRRQNNHTGGAEDFMDQARSAYHSSSQTTEGLIRSQASRAGSVASLGSHISVHAKKLVNTITDFNCASGSSNASNLPTNFGEVPGQPTTADVNATTNNTSATDTGYFKSPRNVGADKSPLPTNRTPIPVTSASKPINNRTFREYSKSPKRMDV